jgi:hypothetical protein
MKKISLLLFLCLHVAVGMTGCKNSEEVSDVSVKDDFPKWLSVKITEIETVNEKDISIIKVRVFQCRWKNRVLYVILNNLTSCMLCEVYYEDGEKIEWSEEDLASGSFFIDTENWELIYEFGDCEIY